MYLLGIGVMYNKDLFAKAGITSPAPGERWTWNKFMDACAKLKKASITCFGIGDRNGYGGAWWWANVGGQNLNSTEELRQAVVGKASFTDKKYTGFYKELDKMVKSGYFNDDVMSRDLSFGADLFSQEKVAMAFGTDGGLKQAAIDLGKDKVGLMAPPKWGQGKLSNYGNATQSISFLITKQSEHPQAAADFLMFLHTPEILNSWHKTTGITPADDRFDTNLVVQPLEKQMMALKSNGPQVWLQNFLPSQVDGDGDLPAGQLIFSQNGTPDDAAKTWQRAAQTWRNQHPEELEKWQNWAQ